MGMIGVGIHDNMQMAPRHLTRQGGDRRGPNGGLSIRCSPQQNRLGRRGMSESSGGELVGPPLESERGKFWIGDFGPPSIRTRLR